MAAFRRHQILVSGLALLQLCSAGRYFQATNTSAFPSFDSFLQQFGRSYKSGTAEYETRQASYEKIRREAALQNSKPNRLWTAGVNDLWDWNEAEFRTLRGYVRNSVSANTAARKVGFLEERTKGAARAFGDESSWPAEKSWTHLESAQHAVNQGACGSCWAIASVRVLDANAEIHAGDKHQFSAQQLVSCVPNPNECGGQGGCRGATVELAMDWVMEHGLNEDYQVPYMAQDGTCPAALVAAPSADAGAVVRGGAALGMTGWQKLPENKYAPLMDALVNHGPVAVSVAAGTWQTYHSGILDNCGKDAVVDHAVTMMGFGVDGANKYWHIQNSWSAHWGEGGYIRMLRHDDDDTNYCGTDHRPEVGTACKGGPETVPVCGMCGILYDSVIPFFEKKA